MKNIVICCVVLILCAKEAYAQKSFPADTVKVIEILRGRSLRHKTIDSLNELQTMAGDAVIRQGGTLFSCDSVTLNKKTNIIEAFGNVKINQGDSIHTYSQYLRYQGNEQQAYLKKNVRLVDKKGSLITQELDYNLKTGIGKYNTGGKVINNKTTITSTQGIYYADTKDVYFIENVRVVDPQQNIKADTMLYNLQTELVNFIGPTEVKNNGATIYTTKGNFDLKNNTGLFNDRSTIIDSGRTYTADNIAFDKTSGNAQLEGNAVIHDSLDGFITTANMVLVNNNNKSFLATRKPVLLIIQGKDTTYISGDTLFSALNIRNKKNTGKGVVFSGNDSLRRTDSLHKVTDSLFVKSLLQPADTLQLKNKNGRGRAGTTNSEEDKQDSSRFFIAYHHVKIYNDSMQSVCDSLYYSTTDSVFKLFQHPIVWSGESQITGDTMLLFTKNKKADRLYVFNNGMIINKVKGNFYNQMGGKTLNGYFINGEINYMKVKGSPAESIYYVQDKDSAFSGMNRANGELIEIFFSKSNVQKVRLLNDVHGIYHPMKQLDGETKYLKNFNWLDRRRPKNKLELFE